MVEADRTPDAIEDYLKFPPEARDGLAAMRQEVTKRAEENRVIARGQIEALGYGEIFSRLAEASGNEQVTDEVLETLMLSTAEELKRIPDISDAQNLIWTALTGEMTGDNGAILSYSFVDPEGPQRRETAYLTTDILFGFLPIKGKRSKRERQSNERADTFTFVADLSIEAKVFVPAKTSSFDVWRIEIRKSSTS